jgi:hypothetical protein
MVINARAGQEQFVGGVDPFKKALVSSTVNTLETKHNGRQVWFPGKF